MKLVLVRHGESDWNKLNLFTGWTDVDLSKTGHREASCYNIFHKRINLILLTEKIKISFEMIFSYNNFIGLRS